MGAGIESYKAWKIVNFNSERIYWKILNYLPKINSVGHGWKKNIKTTIDINSEATEVECYLADYVRKIDKPGKAVCICCDCVCLFKENLRCILFHYLC